MNPNEVDSEERFALLLAACDEALAGRGPPPAAPPDRAVLARLQKAHACLRRLRRRWPAAALDFPADLFRSALVFDPASRCVRLGRFEVRRELRPPGGGIALLGFDPRLEREVVIKVPRPETIPTADSRQRFLGDGRLAAVLAHPHLVPVYETGEVGPFCYVASAYCPGPNLADWLRQRTDPVPPAEAARMVASLADAVHYLHDHGILHRRLKPANVLVARNWDASSTQADLCFQITDFSLSRGAEGQPDHSALTLPGTAAYRAPEQADGRNDLVGPPTDVHALGVLLYETLTGRPPFQGATDQDTLKQVATQAPTPPRRLRPDLPRDLEAICLRCLAKEPAGRYASAAALAEDLRRFLDSKPVHARPRGFWERAWNWIRRRTV
jgi:serine/threonine protein kinase